MKKNIYLAVITLITIGCVIYGACGGVDGFLNRGSSLSLGIGNTKYNIEESANLEPFERILVDASVMDVTIKEGSSYTLDYHGTKNLVMSYRVDNGELVISQRKKSAAIGNHGADLTLTVPKEVSLEKVEIEIDVGEVELKEMKVGFMDVDLDIGDMTVERTAVEQAVIESDTGDVELSACSFVNLDISNDIGDVEVKSSVDISDYAYDLKTDAGEVEVGVDKHGRKYQKEGTNGKIIIRGNVGDITVND